MSDDSGTTIKYGAGYDHPWFTARGTTAAQKKQIAEVFGIEAGDKTLAELTVEAALYAIGLTNAGSGIGAKPAKRSTASPEVQGKTTEEVQASIAQKAAQEAQPEDATDDLDPLIATAMSRKALEDIRGAHKGTWTDAHQLQARQRLAELEK